MSTTILITLIVYKCVLLAVGLWAQHLNQDQEDYFLGGRQLGPVVAAISYGSSSASAWTLLGMSGLAYAIGLTAVWVAAGAVAGAAIAWFWIAPRLMEVTARKGHLTVVDFMADGASKNDAGRIKVIATLIILFCFIIYMSSQFQGAGNVFESTFAMSSSGSILLGGTIILIYTLLGGFWVVSLTDTIQGILMLFAAILLPVMSWIAIGGAEGFQAILASPPSEDWLSFTGANTGWMALGTIAGSIAVGLGTFGQPHLLNRFMALKSKKALRQASVLSVFWFALVFGGMCMLGLAGRTLLPELDNPETLFFALTSDLLPGVTGAIVVAAVLSAIMSTVDSMLLVAAACVVHDLGAGRFIKNKPLLMSRITMTVLATAAVMLAISLPSSIFDRVIFAWNMIGAAFGPVIIISLMGRQIAKNGVVGAMLAGCLSTFVFSMMPHTPGDLLQRAGPFLLATVILLIMSGKSRIALVK